uniref:Uncharacterized protein n=1 Tax=Fundulus heteroclitus TaxID=8078 RepID=A0A3Q2QIB3_FUNHE
FCLAWLLIVARCGALPSAAVLAQDRKVENIQVKQDFDKTRYAVGKKEPEGLMTATTKGSVGSPGPAKFRMKYWGAASYLQTGNDKLGYPHRLRRLRHPLLLYSFVFSRHSTGLRPEDQAIITQRKMDLCLLGRYRRVAHNGFCENSGNSELPQSHPS